MRRFIDRLIRATWTYKQPLVSKPKDGTAVVSDLFVWRCSSLWETFFDLTDVIGLFNPDSTRVRSVKFVFFDMAGTLLFTRQVPVKQGERNTFRLSTIVERKYGELGTFSVFHETTPKSFRSLGSFLSERGYVSYQYQGAALRGYVHGNFDAIAHYGGKDYELLGGGVRRREYRLQLALSKPNRYELCIVNPSSSNQNIECASLAANGGFLQIQKAKLRPGAVHLFLIEPTGSTERVVFKSRMVMARPVVFRIQNKKMDVFHG